MYKFFQYPEVVLTDEIVSLTVERGKVRPILFNIENKGGSDLVLSQISSSCGCITLDKEQVTVPPGSESTIGMVFRDVDGEGFRRYTITALTNDPNRPVVELTANVLVRDEISIEVLNREDFSYSNGDEIKFNVINSGGGSLSLKSCSTSQSWLSSDFLETSNGYSGVFKIKGEPPSGITDIFVDFHFIHNDVSLSKIKSFPVIGENNFLNEKPFTLGVMDSDGDKEFSMSLKLEGVEKNSKLKFEGVGDPSFSYAINGDVYEISLKYSDLLRDYVYRGHLYIVSPKGGECYSHPVYIRTSY